MSKRLQRALAATREKPTREMNVSDATKINVKTHCLCDTCGAPVAPDRVHNGVGYTWHYVHCGYGHDGQEPLYTEDEAWEARRRSKLPCPSRYETATKTWEPSGVPDHCAGCGGTLAEHESAVAPRHLPEPWIVVAPCDIETVTGIRIGDTDQSLSRNIDEQDDALDDANAARIVACVNACAGIADPAAAIEGARVAMKSLIEGWDFDEIGQFDGDLVDALREALTALAGGTP